MNIVFVGDKPSKKNLDPNVPFVGTKSYRTLLDWILQLDVDVSDVVICNSADFKKECEGFYLVEKANSITCLEPTDKIIALGNNADKYLKSLGVTYHYKIDHPSGLNRKLNDKKYVKEMLTSCKQYIFNV